MKTKFNVGDAVLHFDDKIFSIEPCIITKLTAEESVGLLYSIKYSQTGMVVHVRESTLFNNKYAENVGTLNKVLKDIKAQMHNELNKVHDTYCAKCVKILNKETKK